MQRREIVVQAPICLMAAALIFACGGSSTGPQPSDLSRLSDVGIRSFAGGYELHAATEPPDSRPDIEHTMNVCIEGVPTCDRVEGSRRGPTLSAMVLVSGDACVEIDWSVALVYVEQDFGEHVADQAVGTFTSEEC